MTSVDPIGFYLNLKRFRVRSGREIELCLTLEQAWRPALMR